MWIKKAEITSFGKLKQQKFLFEANNQLVFGLNEAGKSTLYQFIQAMLFGFPTKKKKGADYSPTDGSGFGGKLTIVHSTLGEIQIERFKNKNKGKAQLRFADGTVGDEGRLVQLLYPLNINLFQDVFTFQQEQLQQLEQLQENKLHDALISLGLSGSNQLFTQKNQLQQQAETLYRPRGRKLPLNLALEKLEQLTEKIQQKEQQEKNFQELVVAADEAKKQVTHLSTTDQELRKKQVTLEQQRLNFDNYQELRQLQQTDLSLTSTPAEQTALQEYYQTYQQLMKEQEQLHQALQKFSGNQASARYYFYLENETKIKELSAQQLPVNRLIDEQSHNQQQLRETTDPFWQTDLPEPFENDTAVLNFLKPVKAVNQELQEYQIRLNLLTEQQQTAEEQLNAYEKKHPEVFKPKKKQPWGFLLAGVSVLAAVFLPSPVRFVFIAMALVAIIFAIKPKVASGNKETWQDRLNQLDLINEQLMTVKKQVAILAEQQSNLVANAQQELKRRNLSTELEEVRLLASNQKALQFLSQRQKQTNLKKRNHEINQQLLQLTAQFQFLTEWLPLQDKPIVAQFQQLNDFAQEMEQIRFAETYQENAVLQQRIHQNQKEQQLLLNQHQQLLKSSELSYPAEINDYLAQQQKIMQQQQRLQDLSQTVAPLFPETVDLIQINQQMIAVQRQLEETQLKLQQAQEKEQRLRIEIQQMQKDGTLDQLYQQQSQQQAVISDLLKEYAIAKIEGQLLQDIATELSQQQLPELVTKAAEYFQILTGKKARLDFYEGTLTVNQRSVYQLSTGTKDQLIMAFRFAYLAVESADPVGPIIIDDGWLHYDHQRKRQLAELLAKFSQKYQVICLSSDQEMVSYYQELHQTVWELKGA
ncbi:AAA family ATPase [Enterococcus sp. ALS3]|uniref:AAA family ATPase n=1 Tax=Enterococcus alishanensis TaxID=1303817 RepID=A0ABS6THE7_9ENTE|nr:AAA family ATPase [Enterococcus alishanensis]MBV7392331.1 AAA family ATPase [Enterococcus alishanensis]